MVADLRYPRHGLMACNIVLFVFSVMKMVIGLWGRVDFTFKSFTDRIEYEELYVGAYMFCLVGVILFFMSLLGCLGVMKESRPILILYGIVILLIFLAENALAIYLFWWTFRDSPLLPALRRKFDYIMEFYGHNTPQGDYWTSRMNFIQDWFDCCGSNGTDDYLKRPYIEEIPKSCRSVHGWVYEIGCGNRIFDKFQEQGYVLAILGFCVAVNEMLCVIFAFYLAVNIAKNKQYQGRSRPY